MNRKWVKILLILYGTIMLWLLFAREAGPARVNLIPFHTIARFVRCLLPPYRPRVFRIAIINLLGNILLFLPMGFLPPMLWGSRARLWKVLSAGLAIMAAVELLQLFLLVGTCDIDDLILNGIGIALGYGAFRMLHSHKTR